MKFFKKYLKVVINMYRRKSLKVKLGSFGFASYVDKPLRIDGFKNIYIGNNVYIKYKTWLASVPIKSDDVSLLEIGDGSIIGNFNHIYATKEIRIGKYVLIADKVYISDNLHAYESVEIPIMNQPIRQINKVVIGDGTWIGENVCIIGASIGKNCVIGANSVVTKDIPDYCVAVGSPAKIIKYFDLDSKQWIKM